jgi:hypothetical protein
VLLGVGDQLVRADLGNAGTQLGQLGGAGRTREERGGAGGEQGGGTEQSGTRHSFPQSGLGTDLRFHRRIWFEN